MAVTDFPTKAAVAIRDDLAPWQRLNVAGFLVSGLVGAAEAEAIGEVYEDGDGAVYLPLLVQPLLVYEASAQQLQRARARAVARGVALAIYTAHMFATGSDAQNREALCPRRNSISSESGSGRTTVTRTRSFEGSRGIPDDRPAR